MGTKQGYAITTWRLRLRCKHPEWLETTQNFYNEIQKFYYDLYLERPELWNENSQNALRGLETLSIPGRTRKQVEYPLPWDNALLYFRRSAANAAIAAAKSYLTRSAGGYAGKTETFHSAVTYYKGMYRELTVHGVELRVWTGDEWHWMHCRLYGKEFPEDGQLMSPSVVYEHPYTMLQVPVVGFVSFVAANSDNKALFVLAPLFLIVYLIVFKMNFYRNILQKIRSLFRYIIKGFCVFAIFIFGLQPAIGTLDLISDIIEKTQSGLINANAAYGSAERLGIIVYALNNPSIRWYGSGIAKHEWQESYGLGFAHFGISDFGSFLCLGGILFILLLICFLLAVYRTVFKDKIAGYTFFVLTIVVLIYTQPMTVVSLTCSWVFLVFTTVLGCESIKDGNEAV